MAILDRFRKKLTVTVTFVNQLDQSIIGRSELAVEQLPETFAINTVMHLGDEDWQILKAEPCDKSAFVKTRELTLTMQRIESINPADILFSLPTIAGELPGLSPTTFSTSFTYQMREDDWRQCEFFEVYKKARILEEITKVEALKGANQSEDDDTLMGFEHIHIRDLTDVATLSISLLALLHQLQISDVGAIQFENNAGYIAQGFAVETAENIFYGILDVREKGSLELENLVVSILAVQPKSEDSQELVQLLQAFNLLYVDWCHGSVIDRLN